MPTTLRRLFLAVALAAAGGPWIPGGPGQPALAAPPSEAEAGSPATSPRKPGAPKAADVLPFDLEDAQEPAPGIQSRGPEVVATGVGTDPQGATQNAVVNAVEQVVGILVDAETIVNNDEIVRDRVLTYSRGFVEDFKEIYRWQENGLHYVRIRAIVSATRLGEKLKAQNVVLREIEGDKIAIRIRIEELNEEAAKQLFRKAVADFTPDKVLTVSLAEEKPAVERGPDGVKLTVSYRVAANLEAWKPIRANLVPLLGQLSPGRRSGSYLEGRGWVFSGSPPKAEYSLYVFKGMGADGATSDWEDYPVPAWVLPEVNAIQNRHNGYAVRLSLLDDQDRVIAKADHWFYYWRYCGSRKVVGNLVWPDWNVWDLRTNPSIGPLLVDRSPRFRQAIDMSETFTLDTDELARVKKCAASIENLAP
ncbi:MAG TPA: hypothetical protein VMY37_39325 [Thermoguttaceae bacterium]|nr:hypothetical protein [Thermoguttaceae bacterium]